MQLALADSNFDFRVLQGGCSLPKSHKTGRGKFDCEDLLRHVATCRNTIFFLGYTCPELCGHTDFSLNIVKVVLCRPSEGCKQR